MFRNRILFGIALAAVLVLGFQAYAFDAGKKVKRQATFKVRIENISSADGQPTDGGARYPFALSPGMFVFSEKKIEFFREGKKATAGLEAQAEDGNPEVLTKKLAAKFGSINLGIFNTPVDADKPAPILPGGAYEFTFRASEGMRLSLIAMFGQSNDLFYAPKRAIDLFDASGNPLTGDITSSFLLWDAGTEINQAPGIGPDQAPRQRSANTGAIENGVIGMVRDGFTYPNTKDVLRIMITAE